MANNVIASPLGLFDRESFYRGCSVIYEGCFEEKLYCCESRFYQVDLGEVTSR